MLSRLQACSDQESWRQWLEVYEPLIRNWLRQFAERGADHEDVVQEVLAVVVRKLPEFQRREQVGSFRSWLRTITRNCLRVQWRGRHGNPLAVGGTDFLDRLNQLEDPDSGLSRRWDEEHDQHVVQHLLTWVRPHFEPSTWEAFRRTAIEGKSPDEVAAELGMTVNAVFIAKSRVLSRLRHEGAGLLD